ncbi:IclR family transcriptional regulator [Aeromicrobium sp. CF4.19]|uniref:IclR family transcriptional regulator n=1 Tax=Aeromicrobium sp. CF4.19 TaxID=3373082 RepID=UPI003EE559BF
MSEVSSDRPPGGGRIAGTQAIGRAFAVLDMFRSAGTDLGVVQISEQLGFTLSTSHRIARALVAEGYLAQGEGRERYRLGVQALLLGQAAQRSLGLQVARPVLQGLAEQTGESINLGLADFDRAVVAQRIESRQALRLSVEVGSSVELHATSMGKALMAFNDDLRRRVLEGPELPALTSRTLTTQAQLAADLEQIKQRGWSIDDEESMLGVRCLAAPIIAPDGVARAAVAVQAPAVRMPDGRFAELGPEVRRAADELARILPL